MLISDLETLTEEIYHGVKSWEKGSKERLHAALQQMFLTSADEEVDDVKSLTESYHKYKREYVKHLGFNSDNTNLCKFILKLYPEFFASHKAGACTTRCSLQFGAF